MFSEMYYNKIQIYVIKIFEMTHPLRNCVFRKMWLKKFLKNKHINK